MKEKEEHTEKARTNSYGVSDISSFGYIALSKSIFAALSSSIVLIGGN